MGILFNSTALGIHFCETSLIFNFKTRLGGEICLCDVNMHKGYCRMVIFQLKAYDVTINLTGTALVEILCSANFTKCKIFFFCCHQE